MIDDNTPVQANISWAQPIKISANFVAYSSCVDVDVVFLVVVAAVVVFVVMLVMVDFIDYKCFVYFLIRWKLSQSLEKLKKRDTKGKKRIRWNSVRINVANDSSSKNRKPDGFWISNASIINIAFMSKKKWQKNRVDSNEN